MPIPTPSEFPFVSWSYIYPFPNVLIPVYTTFLSLFHCFLILLDLRTFTLSHAPSSSPRIPSLPGYVHPVPDHAPCAELVSFSCNAIIVTEYGSCYGSMLWSLICTLVKNYRFCHRYSFLSRILFLVPDSYSRYRLSVLSQILILVTDHPSCHPLLFGSPIICLVPHYFPSLP